MICSCILIRYTCRKCMKMYELASTLTDTAIEPCLLTSMPFSCSYPLGFSPFFVRDAGVGLAPGPAKRPAQRAPVRRNHRVGSCHGRTVAGTEAKIPKGGSSTTQIGCFSGLAHERYSLKLPQRKKVAEQVMFQSCELIICRCKLVAPEA